MTVTRVAHVLAGMNAGGVESWLMAVIRALPPGLRFELIVHKTQRCFFDDELEERGVEIIPCPLGPDYAVRLARLLEARRPHVVHSHVHHFSAIVLSAALAARIPHRIAHSHNDTRGVQAASPLHRRAYYRTARTALELVATARWACSSVAGLALFGTKWGRNPARDRVIPYGVDFTRFEGLDDGIRANLGLSPDDLVVGSVASFTPQKNHRFLLDVFARAARRQPRARLVLVGDGPLRPEIERQIDELGLKDRVVLTGVRRDVPQLLRAFDVFFFPSAYEGLGIVILEAQAANVPVLCSDVVPPEGEVIPALVYRRSLEAPADAWATSLCDLLEAPRPLSPAESLATMKASAFEAGRAREALFEAYDRLIKSRQVGSTIRPAS